MTTAPEFELPTSAEMLARQNEPKALKLLIAQRRQHTKAKRWSALRWFGMLVIGLAAPVIAVAEPSLAPLTGALAGLWLFVGRTGLRALQSAKTTAAVATQEQFDFYIYGMPTSVQRSALPSREDLAAIAGPDDRILEVASKEELLAWYPIQAQDSGPVSIAISQRANAAYSDRLLRVTAKVWAFVTAIWAMLLLIVSLALDLTLAEFLVGVLLPVLPSVLDVIEYVWGIYRSARLRRDLVSTIESRIRDPARPLEAGELMVWQDELYELRRSTPQVPDRIYKLWRKRNERAMHSAARELSDESDGGAS
jgi:hypothetical protein